MCEVNRFHACAQLTLSSAEAWTFIACTFKNQQCLNPKEARTKRCSRMAVLKRCAARASAPYADLKTCAKGEASEAWERAGGLASWDRALRGETVGTTEWVRLDGVLVGPRQMVRVELRASARLRRARASPWRLHRLQMKEGGDPGELTFDPADLPAWSERVLQAICTAAAQKPLQRHTPRQLPNACDEVAHMAPPLPWTATWLPQLWPGWV